jgi:imidazolonepropionase-like amidohydrolase
LKKGRDNDDKRFSSILFHLDQETTQKREVNMRSILGLPLIPLLITVILSMSPPTQVSAREIDSSYILIKNGMLIDGTGSKPVMDGAVLVHGNKIDAAGPLSTITVPSENVRQIDVNGATITPGFIDAHVHLISSSSNILRFALGSDWSYKVFMAARMAQNTLEAGITTVRDLYGLPVGLKRAINEGLIAGPRIQLSVTGIGGTGGHTDYGLPSGIDLVPTMYPPGAPDPRADGPDEVRKRAREILLSGGEVMKLWATGGLATPHDQPQFIGLNIEEMKAAAEVAKDYEKPLVIHAEGLRGIMNAIAVNPRSIEHGFYLDEKAAQLMADKNIILVPTAAFVAQPTAGLPPYFRLKLEEAHSAARSGFRHAIKAGVKIALGTDSGFGPTHGENLQELDIYVKWGMKPMDAIVAGTKNAAEALAWDDRIGTLETGKLADIVIVKGNPIKDIGILKNKDNILLVIKGGKVVKDRRAGD